MPKKRPPRITHIHTPRRKGKRYFPDISESSGHDILSFLYQSGNPATLNDLLEEVLAGLTKKDIESALETLLQMASS
jgi:hypothetical protein